jgi:hypothetical protein
MQSGRDWLYLMKIPADRVASAGMLVFAGAGGSLVHRAESLAPRPLGVTFCEKCLTIRRQNDRLALFDSRPDCVAEENCRGRANAG